MGWFNFGRNKDDIRDKIRDLERDLRSVEYEYNRAVDELEKAEKEDDSSSERRWDDLAYRLRSKKEDLEYDIKYLESEL